MPTGVVTSLRLHGHSTDNTVSEADSPSDFLSKENCFKLVLIDKTVLLIFKFGVASLAGDSL